jgi:hypothetical protein
MFQLTEANVSCNSLSTSMTYEHMSIVLSSTYIQLIGGGRKVGEPDRRNPNTPRPTSLEDAGARVVSPRAALLGAPMLAPRIT